MQEIFKTLFNSPILARGFRPFFLLGGVYSVLSLLIWGGEYAGLISSPTFLIDTVSWHAHEMIYGFAMAIIAGFLLTAAANWTSTQPLRNFYLVGLCGVWLAGRIVMNFDFGLSSFVIFLIEGSFIPILAISLSIPILKRWNKRNFIFLILLTILFICNVAFYITEQRDPLYVAVMVVVAMISLIGGRVIPAFTVASLRARGEEAFQIPQGRLDVLALLSLVFIICSLLFYGLQGIVLAVICFISAVIHLLRFRRYHTRRVLNDPMVWVLHAGYIWVVIGLFLMGVSALGGVPFSAALHAFTVGAIGTMTLGMMCRVSLGHTGRGLISGRVTTFSFIVMQVAAFMRVFCVVLFPEYTIFWIVGSAFLWSLCFGIYVFVYAPMLWSPRPDGRVA